MLHLRFLHSRKSPRLTDCRYGRQPHTAALALQRLHCRADPFGRGHALQPLLLDVLQLDGDCPTVTHGLPQMKAHPSLLSPSGDSGVHHGALVLSAEVSEAAPAVHGHLHPAVVVVGAAERRRLAAAGGVAPRTGLVRLHDHSRRGFRCERHFSGR